MPDIGYKTFPATFASRGVVARYADDTLPPGTYLNMDNVEELTENAMVSRLGSIIINRTLTVLDFLAGSVHSIAKLLGFSQVWRYAGASTDLYRRTGNGQGAYTTIATGMSGSPWSWATYRPELSSYPYIFIADAAKMLKDNGTLSAPQQWGIFQPAQPVQAVAQTPQVITLDEFKGSTGSYTLVNYTSASIATKFSTTTSAAITTTGLQTVTVGSTANMQQYCLADVGTGGSAEVVMIIALTATTITATFTKTHVTATTVAASQLTGSVAASTTATVTRSGSYALATFPNGVTVTGDDYLAIFLNVSAPNNLQEIRLAVDVSDGTFSSSYFYKVIAPAQYQSSVSDTVTPAQAVAQAVFSEAIDVYGDGTINVAALATGNNTWSPVLTQLSNFIAVGNADVDSTSGYSFANAVAFQIQIVTNTNGSSTVGISDLICFGGAGPDSFGGVSYDWVYTYYNNVTGAESNPCMFMSNINPPQQTTYITPRRQPVVLTVLPSSDSQVTNIRIYRRGGTLSSNYFRVDQIAASSTSYTDIIADEYISGSDPVSLTNDVPVTSTLPVPVNTTLTNPIAGPGIITMVVGSTTNISVAQQVTLSVVTDPAQEVVIVLSVPSSTTFSAWVQNAHAAGTAVTAEAVYGQPCNLAAQAYSAIYLAGDPNNPHYLYYSTNFTPESFGSANFIEVGSPGMPIMAIVPFQGNLYVATYETWYTVAPSTQTGGAPTVYPTSATHGVVATHGWVATETEIWHQAIDGIRTFAGGSSVYRTQEIEFIFQDHGVTPIVESANTPYALGLTTMTYWNNIVFVSYLGTDDVFHRINYHTIYKRWRNDDIAATAMYTEPDTNALIFGDSTGLVHQDRVGTYDEIEGGGGALATGPIALNLQTAYLDQGGPKNQKNYNELTLDCNTSGQTMTATMLYNDGEFSDTIGTFSSTERAKINLNVNAGLGDQAYRVSLQITGSVTETFTIYQADIRGVVLAETRQSMDTYWLKFGTDESKLVKQMYLEYTSTSTLNCSLYYDQFVTPQYTFTLLAAPVRTSLRVRFPAVKFRLFRMVCTSAADFQIWPDSKFEVKPVVSTKGYAVMNMLP